MTGRISVAIVAIRARKVKRVPRARRRMGHYPVEEIKMIRKKRASWTRAFPVGGQRLDLAQRDAPRCSLLRREDVLDRRAKLATRGLETIYRGAHGVQDLKRCLA